MTIQATAWAWEQRGLTPVEKLVLLALSNESSEFAPPPEAAAIAERCEIAEDEAQAVLASLRAGRLIGTVSGTVVS
jgi:hypothetical protein